MTIRTPDGNWTRRVRVISNRGTCDWGHGNCLDWRWEGFAWRYAHWRALLAPMTARFYTKAMDDNTLVNCGAKYTQVRGCGSRRLRGVGDYCWEFGFYDFAV